MRIRGRAGGGGGLAAAAGIVAYLALAAAFSTRMPIFVDETDVVRPALDPSILEGSGGRTIKYPPLPFLVYSAGLRSARAVGSWAGVPDGRFPTLGAARGLNLALAGLALLAFFRAAGRAFEGGARLAILATFFLATTPAFFFATQMAKTEGLLLLVVCSSLLAALRAVEPAATWRAHLALGMLAGLAVGAKLNVAIVALPIAVAWERRRSGEPWRDTARISCLQAGGLLLAIAPVVPRLVALWRHAGTSWALDEYLVPGPSYFRTAGGSILLGRPLGPLLLWLPFAAGIAAWGLALWGLVAGGLRRSRLFWVSYPAAHLAVTLLATPSTFPQLYTPMMPFLAILAASGLADLADRTRIGRASALLGARRATGAGTARAAGAGVDARGARWAAASALVALLAWQVYQAPCYSLCLARFHGNLAALLDLGRGHPMAPGGTGEIAQAHLVSASGVRGIGSPAEIATWLAEGRVRRAIILDSYVHNLCAHGGGEYRAACRVLRTALYRGLGYVTVRKVDTRYPGRSLFRFLDPEFSFTFHLLALPDDPLAREAE